MHCVTNIREDLYWLGASDRRLAKFENVFPIPRGVSYNAYLLLDEKTVLLDTVDKAVGERFFENLEFALAGRPLDYVEMSQSKNWPIMGTVLALATIWTLGQRRSRSPRVALWSGSMWFTTT